MALFELISGDFEQESTRLRYSEAGRAFLRLTSVDGMVEDLFVERDVAGVAESGEGRVGEYLARWAERDGFALRELHVAKSGSRSTAGRGEGRGERLFVVLLRDGRKFVARGSADTVAEIKLASLPADRRAKLSRLDAARDAGAGLLPRFVPGLIARLLPNR
jgi:hypothetical protein